MQGGHTGGANGRLLSGPPAYRPDTPWRPAPALLATALIVIAGMAASVGASVLAPLLSGAPAHPARDGGPPIALRLGALAVGQAVAVVLTLLASGKLGGRLVDVLALRAAPTGWRAYAGALVAVACLQAVLAGAQHFFLRHDLLTDLRPFVGLVSGPSWPLAAIVITFGAALSEELLFRGFLLGALAQSRLGFAGAAIVSSALWAVVHAGYSLLGLVEVFAMGLLFSWLLWRTGSLRVTMVCHAVYNGVIVAALLLVELPD